MRGNCQRVDADGDWNGLAILRGPEHEHGVIDRIA